MFLGEDKADEDAMTLRATLPPHFSMPMFRARDIIFDDGLLLL